MALFATAYLLFSAKGVQADKLEALDENGQLQGFFAAFDIQGSLLSDLAEAGNIAPSFGYSLRVGKRWDDWGVFGFIEHNMWVATELDKKVVAGALNFGVGLDRTYFRGMAHTSLVFGPSVLVFDTPLDDPGSVGIFFEIRPMGFRFAVHPKIQLGVDPINFGVVAPVLSGIPLVRIQYRTAVYGELQW